MKSLADIAVYSSNGRVVLLAEVKNKTGTTVEWAAKMRRNLIIHGLIPDVDYFLLALPDRFYLWCDSASPQEKPPDFTVEAQDVLSPYLEKIVLGNLSEESLHLLVNTWLEDLMSAELTETTSEPRQKWLFQSGLYDSIKQGSIESAVPV